MIWKIWKKSKLNSKQIWKIQKKSKLNIEKIGKTWKKGKLNSEQLFFRILSVYILMSFDFPFVRLFGVR
jgi:hypothetical protein